MPATNLHRLVATLALGLLAALAIPAAAAARPGTTGQSSKDSPHFRVHYPEPQVSDAFAQEVLDGLEVAYSRLVQGEGGTPNAGMQAPISDAGSTDAPSADAEGRTDVYFDDLGESRKGQAVPDPNPPYAAYMQLRLDLAGDEETAVSVATHEFFHVLQYAYTKPTPSIALGGLLSESTANWAIAFVTGRLPGPFPIPHLPLDCAFGDWKGEVCGDGYRQWLFFSHLTEDYGPTFVRDAWERLGDNCSSGCADQGDDKPHVDAIAAEIQDRSGGSQTLESRYHQFALDLWDPDSWDDDNPIVDFYETSPPLADFVQLAESGPGDPTAGEGALPVDHLAARYRVLQVLGYPYVQGGWTLKVSATVPDSVSEPVLLLGSWLPGGSNLSETRSMHRVGSSGGSSVYETELENLPKGTDVLLPLINDSESDGLSFGWSAELKVNHAGTPDTSPAPQLNLGLPRKGLTPLRPVARVSCRRGPCQVTVAGRAVIRIVSRGRARRVRGRARHSARGRRGARRKVRTLKVPLRPRRMRFDRQEARAIPLRFKRHKRVATRLARLLRQRKRVHGWLLVRAVARNDDGKIDRAKATTRLRPPAPRRRGARRPAHRRRR